ncbi:hypothetical protein GCM10010169_57430 [Micromonospora fulviviridis]|uniref:hypothetical protein n=1 Tax=Micromonospora fulviviridis TaxID=47860 RepID=UPI0016678AFA|nr:hypothetical protein [Micromonospora fulviviridis]GGS05117.1 hypothetical protein GCM10010169_57430 [Micromonospora fulviviridis]
MVSPLSRPVAAIWIPSHVDPIEPHLMVCLDHARRCRYNLLGIITTAPWDEVRHLMIDGKVDVVVVAEREHLPPDRTPRIEVAARGNHPSPASSPRGPVPPRQRRPGQS